MNTAKHDPNEIIPKTYLLKRKNVDKLRERAKITHRGNRSECLDDILSDVFEKDEPTQTE